MELIRSGHTNLTPLSDDKSLTEYLWPIVHEIIKTVIENEQNLIIEGCYIPFDWAKDFEKEYQDKIKFYCLIMSDKYIKKHFDSIIKFENVVEDRGSDNDLTLEMALNDNAQMLHQCKRYRQNYIFIDEKYQADIEL